MEQILRIMPDSALKWKTPLRRVLSPPIGVSAMLHPSSDVAFSPSVKAAQERKGSRAAYRRVEERGGWRTKITSDLAGFIAERDSAYFATASKAGQPYVQHRGGPKGFIRVVDEETLAFADFSGNR